MVEKSHPEVRVRVATCSGHPIIEQLWNMFLLFNPKLYKSMQITLFGRWFLNRKAIAKTLLVMKFTVILLVTCLQVSARSFSQTVTLSEKNVSLQKIFQEIKSQTGFSFFFDELLLKQAKKVTIEIKEQPLEMALDLCFKNQSITYSIVGTTIVIKEKVPLVDATVTTPIVAIEAPPPFQKITGFVKDDQGAPLSGVSVIVKGTRKGTITNAEGAFTIDANAGDVLEFSIVGFKTTTLKVGNSNTVNLQMEVQVTTGTEVVVTALGVTKKDKKLGYAVSTVKVEDVQRASSISPITALQGKVAGLNINVMGASGVQSSPSILLRGAKSLRQDKNQTLFVIDGNVIENNTYDADGVDQGSQLKNLNPDDYESITVLKGAAATSLYGSRGANGAIVITTKKGKQGQGLGISFNSNYQIQHIYKNGIGLQNEYGSGTMYQREGNFRPDGTQTITSNSWGPKFDGAMHPAIHDATLMVPYTAQPDNWKVFFQDGVYINNNISLSGGSDKITYRLSYSNLNNKGTLVNNKIDRNSFDFRTTGQINKVFSFDGGAAFSMTNSLNSYGQGRYYWPTGQNVGFMTYYAVPRNADLAAWRNSYRNADYSMKNYGYGLYNDQVNATFNKFDNVNNTRYEKSLLTNVMLKAQLNSWIDVSAKANFNHYKIFSEGKEGGNGAFHSGGYYSVGGNYSVNYNYLFMAHATKKFLKNNLDADLRIVNEIYGNGKGENYGANTSGGLIVPNVFNLSNSVNDIKDTRYYSYSKPNNKVIGAGGILNLSWKDYLNLELTGRQDWISSLTYPVGVPGANNYTVFYPSVNASWIFSDMWKDKMPKWFSFGKLRASVAWVGNGTNPFATSFGSYTQGVVTNMNGQSVITANLQNADVLPNLNLKPEKQRSIELGTNLGFLNDRINFDFAYYKTNTFNQILTIPGILETGFRNRRINAGDIQNRGIEIQLNATPIKSKDLTWDVSFNYTHNRGKIIKFYPGITEYALMGDYDLAGVYAYEGGDFGVLTANPGYISYRAYDPKTGLPILRVGSMFDNTNPDQKAKFQTYYWQDEQYNIANPDPAKPWETSSTRHKIGRVEPDFLAGFNTQLRWKQFSLYAQIDSRIGGWVYSEAYNYGMGRGAVSNSLKYRDQAHGGVARTDSYSGNTVYNGVLPDAVFAPGEKSPINGSDIGGMTFKEAYAKNLVPSWAVQEYYNETFGWGQFFDAGAASKLSWIMLREISLGYQLPKAFISKAKLKGATVRFTARNLGYLYNSLPANQNPESLQSNNPFNPVITGAVPYSRNWALSLNITL